MRAQAWLKLETNLVNKGNDLPNRWKDGEEVLLDMDNEMQERLHTEMRWGRGEEIRVVEVASLCEAS